MRAFTKFLVVLCSTILIVACTSTARIYNIDTGQVINASFENYGTGHGKITATLPTGETLQGEYSTIDGTSYTHTTVSGYGYGSGGYAWASAQGFSWNLPGKQYGSATLVGGGYVIDPVYVVSPVTSHGHGVGKDNKGNQYKLQF